MFVVPITIVLSVSHCVPTTIRLTLPEQIKHYKAELQQYLSSWKGLSMSTSTSLYDSTSDTFKEFLHGVYRVSNSKLSVLLHDMYKIDAFEREHLVELGWVL